MRHVDLFEAVGYHFEPSRAIRRYSQTFVTIHIRLESFGGVPSYLDSVSMSLSNVKFEYEWVHTYTHTHMQTIMHALIQTSVHTYIHTCPGVYVYIYVYGYIGMDVHTYTRLPYVTSR